MSLIDWINLKHPRLQRRYLEAHLELLSPESDRIINTLILQNTDKKELVRRMKRNSNLLHEVRAHGGTVAAVGTAFVDQFGGFALEPPSWFESFEQQLIRVNTSGQLDQYAALLRQAIERTRRDFNVAPEFVAWLQWELGTALSQDSTHRLEACREALDVFGRALEVYTLTRYPHQYAETMTGLGNIYCERVEGERKTNCEQAIACFEAVLRTYNSDTLTEDWALIQYNLGNTHRVLFSEGKQSAHLERAISCYKKALLVYTLEDFPEDFAMAQSYLGHLYFRRSDGERNSNLRQAITCYEAALRVYTLATFPVEWAKTQRYLGNTYLEHIHNEGGRKRSLEEAITCYEAVLRVFTRNTFPVEWAEVQTNLGNAYARRIEGEPKDNLERAIRHYHAALQIFTRDTFPKEWAKTQGNLGNAYLKRIEGKRSANLERAIACYEATLQIYTRDAFPREWAQTQVNLGNVYSERVKGQRRTNLEQAITYSRSALQVFTRGSLPIDWANLQDDLGCAYRERIEGNRSANLEHAVNYFKAALQIRTLEAFPAIHRGIQIRLAEVEAERQNWEAAHYAYARASGAEDILVGMGTDTAGRDAILKEGLSTAVHNGFALVRLGRAEEAAVAIERGRARGLAEAMALNAAEPTLIHNIERRERYIAARWQLIYAQEALNALSLTDFPESERRRIMLGYIATCHTAQEAFNREVAEIRQAQDPPDFLVSTLDAATILRTAERYGQSHALVYLTATPWGGFALAALSASPHLGTDPHFAVLDLLRLTSDFVDDLVETKLDGETQRIIGGFAHPQEGRNPGFILHEREDGGLRELVEELVTACKVRGKASTLAVAARSALSMPALTPLAGKPLRTLSESELYRLSSAVGHFLLQLELKRCLDQLSSIVMRPLISWLCEEGVTSLTLIPCGRLAAFPLTAVPLADGRTIGETLITSVAPSVRSLLQSNGSNQVNRAAVYALGDPWPTNQRLVWGEAEALTLAKLARNLGIFADVKVQKEATREWFVQALREGYVIDASCHGRFDRDAPLESALSLARGKSLRLSELLNHEVDLRGLRLLILSACQTAILDLRGAIDEVRSLAVGMLQAGAKAVLAALWSVDDQATYLLMVRFAQEWLPRMESEPPAAALARAQRWLRTVTNRQLHEWHAIDLPTLTEQERRESGSETPDLDLWQMLDEPIDMVELAAGYKHGDRYDMSEAGSLVQTSAVQRGDPDRCPYADPMYWAGFQITGW